MANAVPRLVFCFAVVIIGTGLLVMTVSLIEPQKSPRLENGLDLTTRMI